MEIKGLKYLWVCKNRTVFILTLKEAKNRLNLKAVNQLQRKLMILHMSVTYLNKQKYTKFQYKCRYCNKSISRQKKCKQFRI